MKCDLGNIAVYYETIGEGNPFVTISGQPSAHQIIKIWMEPIFEKRPGWQRFYFDLPGTGQTPGMDWIDGSDQMLDVVCEFIDAVIPNQTFTLLGLSYGGYLARGVVYRKPEWVNGLCLLVPYLQDHDEAELPQSVTFLKNPDVMAQLDPDDVEKLDGLAVIQTQKIVDWYRDVVIPARVGMNRPFVDKIAANDQFSFELDHFVFDKPGLILSGRQDTHVGYADAMKLLGCYPRATLTVLDRAGHALGMEQETLFRTLVNEWLDRVEEQTAR